MENRRLRWALALLAGFLGGTAPVAAQSEGLGTAAAQWTIERPLAPPGWAAPLGAVAQVEDVAVAAGSAPATGRGPRDLGLAAASASGGDGEGATVVAGARGVDPFALAGVSTADGGDLHAELRVQREDGSWSDWLPLEGATANDGGRSGSEPLWVGRAVGYELSVPGGAPPDLRLHLVRLQPADQAAAGAAAGPGEAEEVRPAAAAASWPVPAGVPADSQPPLWSGRRPPPAIHDRGSWGARPVDGVDVAKEVRGAVVHHTADGAPYGYGSADVPGMLRAIQAYHQDALGWWDIGYNFLVDRFGRIWEGRTGGVSKAVIGAHAGGFNTATVGVAVLGDFRGVGVDGTIFEALTQVISWKLFLSGADPATATVLVARSAGARFPAGTLVPVPRIVGHSDLNATVCPADIAARLAELRTAVQHRYASFVGGAELGPGPSGPAPAGAEALGGDFNGDGRHDVLWHTGDDQAATWFGQGDGSSVSRLLATDPWLEALVGDFDGEGTSDVLWHGSGPAVLWYHRSSGDFRPAAQPAAPHPAGAAFDGDGDGDDDIVWYDPDSGEVTVWLSLGPAGFRPVLSAVMPGARPVVLDANGDGRDDLLWYRAGQTDHALWHATGDLAAMARGPAALPGDREPAVGDFDGDDRDDLVLHGPSGTTVWWANFSALSELRATGTFTAAVGDLHGGGADELLLVDHGAGTLVRFLGSADRAMASSTQPAPAGLTPLAGDVNGDARADLRWVGSDGSNQLWLAA